VPGVPILQLQSTICRQEDVLFSLGMLVSFHALLCVQV
jgi:hypothetical protein